MQPAARPAPAQTRFHALDGWRGICALLVALHHIPIKAAFLGGAFFDGTYLFVDFFFVLSGFVIAHAYGAPAGRGGWFAFVCKRFGRLWPLHVAVLACFVAINIARLSLLGWYGHSTRAAASWHGLLISTAEQLLLLQSASFLPQAPGVLVNGPNWSISTEFWTYMLFAIVTAAGQTRHLAVKTLIIILSACIIVRFQTDFMNPYSWVMFFRCFYGFFIGQLVYALYTARPQRLGFAAASAAEFFLLICAVTLVTMARASTATLAAPLLFAGIVYCFAAESGALSAWLKTRPLQALGRTSYSVYMTHALLIAGVTAALHLAGKFLHQTLIHPIGGDYLIDFGPAWLLLALAALILAATIYVSSLTYRYIEKPGQRFFSQIAARQTAPVQSVKQA